MNLLFLAFWRLGGNLTVALIVAQLILSVALVMMNDWFFRRRAARRHARILELEALFALPDPRDITRSRRNIRG